MHLAALYNLFGINEKLFFMINGVRSPLLDEVMVLGTNLGDFWNLPWIVVAAALLLLVPKLIPKAASRQWFPKHDLVVQCMASLLTAYVVAALLVVALKVGLHMPRPAAALPAGTVHVLAQPESPFSFPSGHAAFAMLVAGVFWPYCRWWLRAVLIVFVAWVGISRISVGAHFPVDVAAGYFCGVFSVWLGRRVLKFHSRGRTK